MTRIALIGLGEVGVRAGRQLVDTASVHEVVLVGRDESTAKSLAESLGPKAVVGSVGSLPDRIDAVAIAVPERECRVWVAAAVDAGVSAAVCLTSAAATRSVLEFHDGAIRSGATVIAGTGMAPGVSDVLVAHATALFDTVDEIKVAAVGWAGDACFDAVVTTRREPARRRRNGRPDPLSKALEELIWFPDPIGARDCEIVTGSLDGIEQSAPGVADISVMRGDDVSRRRFSMRANRRLGDDGQWGAVRCEVWGRSGGAVEVVVYGVVERTAVAAGTMTAVSAIGLATGAGLVERPAGVVTLAAIGNPVELLAELADRGIRAAVFEGAPLA